MDHDEALKKSLTVEKVARVVKVNAPQQIVTGVVMRPDYVDAHGDYATRETIERAAHRWLIESQMTDWNHQEMLDKLEAVVVESYLSPVDWTAPSGDEILAGDWIVSVYIPNRDRWLAVQSGEINAFSIMGYASRKPAQT